MLACRTLGGVARVAALGLVVSVLGCSAEESKPRELFSDVTQDAGLTFRHHSGAQGKRNMPETVGGGAAWIDFDGDDRYDLYLVDGNERSDRGGEGSSANELYRNAGAGKFERVPDAAGANNRGYGFGVAVGDVDGDGRSDLFVANYGPDVLYRNAGGRFERVPNAFPTPSNSESSPTHEAWSTSAAFLDADGDGVLDLYVCRYVVYDPDRSCESGGEPTYCSPGEFPGAPDRLYRGRGDGTFLDVSESSGVAIHGPDSGKSLGVVALDYDDDGDQDIYVACDQVPNLLLSNRGDGTFEEVALEASVAFSATGTAQAGMGVDCGDYDLDGRPDLVVTNFSDEPIALYRNEGGGFFRERSAALGVGGPTVTPLGFGVVFIDNDLDGDLDLFVGNGHVQDNVDAIRPGMRFPQPDQLFENRAGTKFVDRSADAGAYFARALVTRAVATCDYDDDGDEDIAIVTNAGPAVLLGTNAPPGSHWVAFRLVGRQATDGYGAKVRVTVDRGGETAVRAFECRSARSYTAACDPRVRVGLGPGPVTVPRVEIRWPSGTRQTLADVAIDRVHRVVEPEG